jgi:lactate dehydrogenase-like 2-hydroxyacid dehydrogenase
MKIAIFSPKTDFTSTQLHTLSKLGEIDYLNSINSHTLAQLKAFSNHADLIAPHPEVMGGFEKAEPILTQVMQSLPNLKGVCLYTTSYGWIDLEYCRQHHLPVSHVPGYSKESVAEHTLALLMCLSKRILVSDRQTQLGKFELVKGFELAGKTLGIVGLGNIGSRVAQLGQGIGMKVIAYNHTPKHQRGVEMVSYRELLKHSDAITFHVTHEPKNENLMSRSEISLLKPGVIIVNTADRKIVNELALAKALKSGKVYGYAYEAENLIHTPLAQCPNAIGLKEFAWYTKEALANLYQIWTDNIVSMAQDKPQNLI